MQISTFPFILYFESTGFLTLVKSKSHKYTHLMCEFNVIIVYLHFVRHFSFLTLYDDCLTTIFIWYAKFVLNSTHLTPYILMKWWYNSCLLLLLLPLTLFLFLSKLLQEIGVKKEV